MKEAPYVVEYISTLSMVFVLECIKSEKNGEEEGAAYIRMRNEKKGMKRRGMKQREVYNG